MDQNVVIINMIILELKKTQAVHLEFLKDLKKIIKKILNIINSKMIHEDIIEIKVQNKKDICLVVNKD